MLITGPHEFAATSIPGFRDALFQSIAHRLREADAQIADTTDQTERPPAERAGKPEARCRRGPDRSASDKGSTSRSLTSRSHGRWG